MTREVILSAVAKKKLEQLLNYLEEEFSKNTKFNFISALEKILERITHYPESFPKSLKVKSVRKCLVGKHTIMFYRFNKNRIEILTLFDSRQNPEKMPY